MQNLVKKAQKGDDGAFYALFHQYEQDIYRMAFVYVKNQNDALDVVQETAYRSFKSIKTLKDPSLFKTWLIRIAVNCSLDVLRKRKAVGRLLPEVDENISGDLNEEDVSFSKISTNRNLVIECKNLFIFMFPSRVTLHRHVKSRFHIKCQVG